MKIQQLSILNCLRADFKKWAHNIEPNKWSVTINEIGRCLTGIDPDRYPAISLFEGDEVCWYICMTSGSEHEIKCYPLDDMTEMRVYEIRRLVESWLARKDLDNFFV